jgi:hypothetical protein
MPASDRARLAFRRARSISARFALTESVAWTRLQIRSASVLSSDSASSPKAAGIRRIVRTAKTAVKATVFGVLPDLLTVAVFPDLFAVFGLFLGNLIASQPLR